MKENPKYKLLIVSYVITIFYSLFFAIPYFSNSSFLSLHFTKNIVNILFLISGIIAVLLTHSISKAIHKYHNYETMLTILSIAFISTFSLAFASNSYIIAILFIIHFVSVFLLYITINLYTEEFETEKFAGESRGLFLICTHFALLISPLIASQVANSIGLQATYLVSSCMLIPLYIFMHHYYKHVKEPRMDGGHALRALRKLRNNNDLKAAFAGSLMFEIFASTFAIYAAPAITSSLNISLNTFLAVIIPIALIPAIILPYYIGILSDKKIGEKEFSILGLSIMGISALLFPFILDRESILSSSNIIYIAGFFFFLRVGTTLCQTAIYSYFYKKVEKRDADMISLFAITWPIGAIIAATTGEISNILEDYLNINNYTIIFLSLFIFVLIALKTVSKMKDTR